jgi:hypothetical protein
VTTTTQSDLDALRDIEDPLDRAHAANETLQAYERAAADVRQERDAAIIVLIKPFVDAIREGNIIRGKAEDDYYGYWLVETPDTRRKFREYDEQMVRFLDKHPDAKVREYKPRISSEVYQQRIARSRAVRAKALAEAGNPPEPSAIYNRIGVTRSLMNRLMARVTDVVPDVDDPEATLDATQAEINRLKPLIAAARQIRDQAIHEAMDGEYRGLSVTEIGRRVGISTPRVWQIRDTGGAA